MSRTVALAIAAILLVTAAPAIAQQHVAASVHIGPLEVSLELQKTSIDAGRSTRATAVITNLGGRELTEVAAILLVDPSDVVLKPKEEQFVGSLAAGRRTSLSWSVCAQPEADEPVNYLVVVQVSAMDGEREVNAESLAKALTVTVPRKSRACAGGSQ